MAGIPPKHELDVIAKWYMNILGAKENIIRLCENRTLRVATLCSGIEAPAAILRALTKALDQRLKIEHAFSCEYDAQKRDWIKCNFPDIKIIFGDVAKLAKGKALNHNTGLMVEVPSVDLLIVSFVSTHKECRSKTGILNAVMEYINKCSPGIVICESVQTIVRKNNGDGLSINDIQLRFDQSGYCFTHRVLNANRFLLPFRRDRCWMMAYRGHENNCPLKGVLNDLRKLSQSRHFTLDYMLNQMRHTDETSRALTPVQESRLSCDLKRVPAGDVNKDIIVDVGKKSGPKVTYGVCATPCIFPNSSLYRVSSKRILSIYEMLCVQGIYAEDFPALSNFVLANTTLVRKLAGNAFSSTVCMAVIICCLKNLPSSSIASPQGG